MDGSTAHTEYITLFFNHATSDDATIEGVGESSPSAAATTLPPLPIRKPSVNYDFDVVVIGGGAGGIACAKECAKWGAKVGLVNGVKPGLSWGLGGTCVHAGCIPKKIMHQASLLGETLKDFGSLGWRVEHQSVHDWGRLVKYIQQHVRGLNEAYLHDLESAGVEHIQAFASFVDDHTIECACIDGGTMRLTSMMFVVAVGCAPHDAGYQGAAECCISCDDIFWRPHSPGKTLVVGGGYTGLECGGAIQGLGFPTTVMIRTTPLRGFDEEMAQHVVASLKGQGVRFLEQTYPMRFERHAGTGRVSCYYFSHGMAEPVCEEYDTVILAVGRKPVVERLNLPVAGVTVHPVSGKIEATQQQTKVPHIFAIGDAVHDVPELTPVAIKEGIVLGRRLFGGVIVHMDYALVPAAVFTPVQYACIGLSEELAVSSFGKGDVQVYYSYYTPFEWKWKHAPTPCYMKLITVKSKRERVVGLHILGPQASEIIQGFALAMRCKATKQDFDDMVGILPTCAEELTRLHLTKGV